MVGKTMMYKSCYMSSTTKIFPLNLLLFQSIGNSIHPSIRLEVDYPSRHEDGRLLIHVLDLKVWIEKRRCVGDGGQDHDVQVVLHEFYYKDVASKSVINARSALPWSCKRTILMQVLRTFLTVAESYLGRLFCSCQPHDVMSSILGL